MAYTWYGTANYAGDGEAIAKAREDVRAGRAVSHDDVLREFGL